MISEAMRQLSDDSRGCCIQQLLIKTPLIVSRKGEMTEMVTSFKPVRYSDRLESEWWEVTISSFNGNSWTRHCVGQVKSASDDICHEKDEACQAASIHKLPRSVASKAWYRALKYAGLEYGPHFQLLDEITAHPVENIANAIIHSKPEHAEYPVHPTVIDQCLQLAGLAGCRGRTTLIDGIAIPKFFESIYVGEGGQGNAMLAETKGVPVAGTHAKFDTRLVVGERTAFSVQGAVIVQLERNGREEKQPLASYIEWKPDADLVSMKDVLGEKSSESNSLVDSLSALSVIQIHRAIKDVVPVPRFEEYKQWISEQVESIAESAVPEASKWTALDDTAFQCLRDGLSAKLKTHGKEESAILSTQIVEACAEILRGVIDPVELLSQERLRKYHEHATASDRVSQLFGLMCHTNPRLRILDIGGGFNRLTTCAMDALTTKEGHCWSKYTWTDVSSDAVEAAQKRLGDKIECCVLDITGDLTVTNFQESGYDIVMISDVSVLTLCGRQSKEVKCSFIQVLCTASQADAALPNIRKLLAPGGRILIQEMIGMC